MTSIGIFLLLVSASPYTVWHQVYDGGQTDKAHGLCLDSAGRVVVIGETNPELDFDCWAVFFSRFGDSLWSKYYDDGRDEKGVAITTARNGTIGIAITSVDGENQKIETILCDSMGELLWKRENNASSTIEATAITSSVDDRIYTAGNYSPPSVINTYLTLDGYDYNGDQVVKVNAGVNRCYIIGDLQADELGYIYLGGDMVNESTIRKISPIGDREWIEIYEDNRAKGFGLEMNDAPHLFQSGDVATTGSNCDFLLLKWDTTGALIWPEHKAYDLGHNEYCRDIKLDDISDCYLAGWQVRGLEKDAALVKTDSAGWMLWSWVYEMEGDQEIEGIEVDSDGYIYLAGSHHNGENWDMLVMQVRQPLIITGRVTDSVGSSMENIRVVLTGDTTVEVYTDTGGYYSIHIYNGGDYTVSPSLPGWAFTPPSHTYSPLAHREFDQNFSGEWTGIEENVIPFYPSWELTSSCGSQITLQYSGYPHGFHATIFDATGRKVDRLESSIPSGTITWGACYGSSYGSGVYFIRAAGDQTPKTKRIVLIP